MYAELHSAAYYGANFSPRISDPMTHIKHHMGSTDHAVDFTGGNDLHTHSAQELKDVFMDIVCIFPGKVQSRMIATSKGFL